MHVVSSSTANASTLLNLYVQVEHNLMKEGSPLETVADTVAQVTVAGHSEMHDLCLSESDLCKTAVHSSHVSNSQLSIIGSYPVIQCWFRIQWIRILSGQIDFLSFFLPL